MRRLLALGAVGALCAIALIAYVLSWPSQVQIENEFANKPYYAAPDHPISKSPKCIATAIKARIAEGDNVRILMGSSELALVEPLPAHPYHFFNEGNYQVDTISIGNAGYQSLFHAIELGALDQLGAVPGNKAAIIVSMQWFMGDGCQSSAFQKSFSWEAYEAFMSNGKVSDETKEKVKLRAEELGLSSNSLNAACGAGSVEDKLNYAIDSLLREGDRLKGISATLPGLRDLSDKKVGVYSGRGNPSWSDWIEVSLEAAMSECTTNDWGIYDSYWENYTHPWLEKYNPDDYAVPFFGWENNELLDLELFFQVCKETGVQPLVIIMPVKGAYYDLTQYPKESRDAYYKMVQNACTEAGVEFVSYVDHEYDKYFMHDIMHLGSLGWVYINHDMMRFFLGEDIDELPEIEFEAMGVSPYASESEVDTTDNGGTL